MEKLIVDIKLLSVSLVKDDTYPIKHEDHCNVLHVHSETDECDCILKTKVKNEHMDEGYRFVSSRR